MSGVSVSKEAAIKLRIVAVLMVLGSIFSFWKLVSTFAAASILALIGWGILGIFLLIIALYCGVLSLFDESYQ